MTGTHRQPYAYAFVRADTEVADGLTGIGPQPAPIRLLRHGSLGVLVSDVDLERLNGLLDTDLTEDGELAVRAREHDHVVRAAAEHGPVLPFRFGTVLRDDAAGDRLLAEHHDTAVALLAHLGSRQEWGIRLRAQPRTDDEPSARDRGSGTSYLASRARRLRDLDRQSVQARETAEAIRQDLVAWAADTADRPKRDALLNVAVLVEPSAEDDFLRYVGHLAVRAADAGLLLDVTGPWPPYSFSPAELEARDG
jgi:Gas vesicle synthesis protein GvpL/GvpF